MLAHALEMPASSSPLLLHKWNQCCLSAPIEGGKDYLCNAAP